VKIAPGLWVESPTYAKNLIVGGDDRKTRLFRVTLRIEAKPASGKRVGRLECTEVCISRAPGAPEITSEIIRAHVPVAEMMKESAKLIVRTDSEEAAQLLRPPSNPGSRARPTKDVLQRVALLYRLALVLREPPTKYVADNFGLARSTAERWVRLARDQKFLGPSEGPGKAAD
jgi:hypothetical protein